MYQFNRRPFIQLFTLFVAMVGFTAEGMGNEKSMGQAAVAADTLKAYAEASSSSNLVALLKKGDVVSIILRVSTSGDDWCRIVLPGQSGLTGYVLCKALSSISAATQVSGTVPVQSVTAVVAHHESTAPPISNNVRPLSNNDVLNMHKAGLPAEVLVAKIRSSLCDFDTSPAALGALKSAGIADSIILSMVEAPIPHSATAAPATPGAPVVASPYSATNATPENRIQKIGTGSTCVILKRMGPADQITSHLYAFGLRGKQFQYVEGDLPKGVKFHGRLTDHDVRAVQDHAGKVLILEPKYSVADLEEARKGCQTP
jgi:hypothetical protein